MKKIGLISTNRLLAQSLHAALDSLVDLELELIPLQNLNQAVLDADVLQIDIAVVDILCCTKGDIEQARALCQNLRSQLPECKIMILVSQENELGKRAAMNAKKRMLIDDFIFYDTSLDYLITKFVDLKRCWLWFEYQLQAPANIQQAF